MTRTESVDEWEKILSTLVEHEEIVLGPEDDARSEAWAKAQQEDELARLRAIASQYIEKQGSGRPPGDYCEKCASRWCICPPAPQEPPACDPEAIRRLIDEARGIHGAAKILADLPHAQRYEPLVAKLQGIAQAAQAILDGLYKLH